MAYNQQHTYGGSSDIDEQKQDDERQLSKIESIVVQALSGVLMGKITALSDDDSDDDGERPIWRQSVINHFNDAWEGLESSDIWNRVTFLVAVNGCDDITWESTAIILHKDMMEVADTLKDFVITALMDGDYTESVGSADDTDTANEDDSDDAEDDFDTE
jgi:hypothetical protein